MIIVIITNVMYANLQTIIQLTEMTKAMEPFLVQKLDKIDKFREVTLTRAQLKNPSFLERYIEQYLRSVH